MTDNKLFFFHHRTFQLTSSQGGWLLHHCTVSTLGLFQLTSSHGGWLYLEVASFPYAFFNSHPHKEDDVRLRSIFDQHRLFNSHPHKEDDQPIDGRKSFYNFSTHILTRRMTLSRRSIKSCKTFQLTSSQGGWHLLYRFYPVAFLFNSHPHKEDDVNVMLLNAHSVFQLTSSQGGWRVLEEKKKQLRSFQLTSSQGGWPPTRS